MGIIFLYPSKPDNSAWSLEFSFLEEKMCISSTAMPNFQKILGFNATRVAHLLLLGWNIFCDFYFTHKKDSLNQSSSELSFEICDANREITSQRNVNYNSTKMYWQQMCVYFLKGETKSLRRDLQWQTYYSLKFTTSVNLFKKISLMILFKRNMRNLSKYYRLR